MQVVMCTAAGEQHGLINTLTNSVEADGFKNINPKIKTTLENKKKHDSKIVEARYLNSRGMHERLTKPYCKYAGDPIQIWHLIPGHTYKLPLGMIEEVNDQTKRLPKRSGLVSVDGTTLNKDESPLEKDQEGEQIHMLVPVQFT